MTDPYAWQTRVGYVWAQEWQVTDRSFAGMSPALEAAILAVAPDRGKIVDIGCGAGATTLAVSAARRDAEVIGIDLSEALLDVARTRAGDRAVRFVHGDARDLVPGLAPVDLFISRHGVMFFDDPVAAFIAFRRAGTPDARLVFSCFADRAANAWATEPVDALGGPGEVNNGVGPFAFADPDIVGAVLHAAGWRTCEPRRVDYCYIAGEGTDAVDQAVRFFSRIGPAAMLLRDARDRRAAQDAVAAVCRRHLEDEVVAFPASAWLWSGKAGEAP